MRKIRFATFILTLVPFLLVNLAAQGGAIVTGKITDSETGDPLPGANILIELTNYGAATDVDGNYRINVGAGSVKGQTVKLTAMYIGYSSQTVKTTLSSGTINQDFQLVQDVLEMDAIIVTGVIEGTSRKKLAFTVGHVSEEALQKVTAISAEEALRGKVAGVKIIRGSGEPGTDASVMLRAPTSINATGRSQDPLYIIDGIIIDPSISGSPFSDINTEDIVSIDVIKGAAGASLYGSRAANGVVNIRTNRGKGLALNQTRIRIRNEIGFNELRKDYPLTKSHYFRINEGASYTDDDGITVLPGDFIDADGNYVDPRDKGQRIGDRYTGNFDPDNPDTMNIADIYFADKPYKWISTGDILLDETLQPLLDSNGRPIGLRPLDSPINQIQQFFNPGGFMLNSVSLSRNMENTNFSFALSNRREDGVIAGLNGYQRQTMRLGLDHSFQSDLSASITAYYSSVERDDITVGVGSPFFGMVFTSGDVDLAAKHADLGTITRQYPDGLPQDVANELFIIPDPNSERANPIYEPLEAVRKIYNTRFMGGLSLGYRPFDWFKLDGNFSYDRSNREQTRFFPVGYQSDFDPDIVTGRYVKWPSFDVAMNGNITATYLKGFLDQDLTIRAKVRALFERSELQYTWAQGTDLAVRGIPDLGVANSNYLEIDSKLEEVRSNGYFFIAGFDYKDKYIGDFMFRNDASSLFGPEERNQNYYRVSSAYRMAEEPWWFIDKIQEFKIRLSYGTAGGRPNFLARYETWGISAGNVSKSTLGNKTLKPQFSKELEYGVDLTFLDRFSLELTRAATVTENQLLEVPLASYYGYKSQWRNAGTLSTKTWEASLNGTLIQTRDMSFSFNILFDKTSQEVTKLDMAPYIWVPYDTQGLKIFRIEEGVDYGALWGSSLITDTDDLLLQGVNPEDLSQFQVNDDGYVVWVGEGESWRNGIKNTLWGTYSELQLIRDGKDSTLKQFDWGMPVRWVDETGNNQKQVGTTVPKFNWSTSMNLEWKGLSLYTLVDAQVGGDLYSQTIQWGYGVENNQGKADMAGKSDELKKPTLYHSRSRATSTFIFDASYIKLRELSLKYTFKRNLLQGIFGGTLNKISIGVVGRNLFTIDNYDEGYDPEVGITGDSGGSAVVTKIDAFRYPNFRTFTGILEIEF